MARDFAQTCPNGVHPLAFTPDTWKAMLGAHGERPFRVRQILRWLFGRAVVDPADMTDLALPLRDWLQSIGLGDPARLLELRRAPDRTRKLLLELADGARVECVLIPMVEEPIDSSEEFEDADSAVQPALDRVTVCISTQYGCAVGCPFCASGQYGLGRSLGAHEILAQVIWARKHLDPQETLRNLVFMGTGEPLANYAATVRALALLTDSAAGAMSPRRITVSTAGIVPGIESLGRDFGGRIGLALSLHAPDDATRNRIVPINRRYPIASVLEALRRYPLPRRRRITIEYTMIAGLNDQLEKAERLACLLRGLHVKVNLIPMNRITASPWQPPSIARVEAFRDVLLAQDYSCFVRASRGEDVAAACGQLGLAGGLVRTSPAVADDGRCDEL